MAHVPGPGRLTRIDELLLRYFPSLLLTKFLLHSRDLDHTSHISTHPTSLPPAAHHAKVGKVCAPGQWVRHRARIFVASDPT